MMLFLEENWGNVLVLAGVAAVAAAAAWRLVKGRRAGKSGCGCGCGDCPARGACRSAWREGPGVSGARGNSRERKYLP